MMEKVILLSLLLMLPGISSAAPVETGHAFYPFRVEDGEGRLLDSRSLRGKVIVGFYEDRHATEKNRELKKALAEFRKNADAKIRRNLFRLAVTDATPANALTRWIWRKKIVSKSKREGVTIYGDWDGSMKKAYGFPDGDSSFIIIDREGIIRYMRSGKIPSSEYPRIFKILSELEYENIHITIGSVK